MALVNSNPAIHYFPTFYLFIVRIVKYVFLVLVTFVFREWPAAARRGFRQEKDALEWSKQRLGELLGGLQIVDGQAGLWVKTTSLQSCTGEAYVNKRKGKIIPVRACGSARPLVASRPPLPRMEACGRGERTLLVARARSS